MRFKINPENNEMHILLLTAEEERHICVVKWKWVMQYVYQKVCIDWIENLRYSVWMNNSFSYTDRKTACIDLAYFSIIEESMKICITSILSWVQRFQMPWKYIGQFVMKFDYIQPRESYLCIKNTIFINNTQGK